MREVLGVVAARAGSRAIEGKNLCVVGGKPLLSWTLEAGLSARKLDRMVLSTDGEALARIGRAHGVEVPFIRPSELATDEAESIDVVLHALDVLAQTQGYHPSHVMLLQPTSPLRTAADIDAACALLDLPQTDAVLSVSLARPHPHWTKRIDKQGYVSPFVSAQPRSLRRQELDPAYAVNGAIYLVSVATLRREGSLTPTRTRPYVMPPERALDVDLPHDLAIASHLLGDHGSSEVE